MPERPSRQAPAVSRQAPAPSRQARAPSRLEGRATWLISRAYARSHGLLTDGFAASGTGLRSYHYRVLAALEEWGPASQADLGRSTSIDRSDMVSILGELERRGLVQRAVDPANLRRNIVSITQAGSEQLELLDNVVAEVQERMLAPLSPDERRQLTGLLHKLNNAGG